MRRGRRAGAERETSRREGVKYLKINAISNAQSDYIAGGGQRCEGSDGFFSSPSFLVRIKVFIEKKQAYLHPDEEPRRRHLRPPLHPQPDTCQVRLRKSVNIALDLPVNSAAIMHIYIYIFKVHSGAAP